MKLVDGFYYPENAVQTTVLEGRACEWDYKGDWTQAPTDNVDYPLSLYDMLRLKIRIHRSVVREVCHEGPEYDIVIGYDAMGIAQTQTVNATGFMLANYDYEDYRTLMEAFSET